MKNASIEKYKILDYFPTIGIECHVQLKTKTKLFSGVSNDARTAEPNTLISHICFGLPGALPVLNEKAVELAVRASFALHTTPQKFSKFDRKHYFYPDLPLGYQISQYDQPIILGGYVEIEIDGKIEKVNITRAHLEADAGKSTHPEGKDYSLVDLNRAGTPLLEIVSEPELHSANEAKLYAEALYNAMKFAEVSDVDLYHGNMRFDVNVSVSKEPNVLGTRTETKNLNSFKSIEKAVEFEIKRQIEVLEKGEEVVQETRGWDDTKLITFSQRSKEDAHDYRYFPDPDLPPIVLDDKYIKAIRQSMPPLYEEYFEKFTQLSMDPSAIRTLLQSTNDAALILEIVDKSSVVHAKRIANLIVNTSIKGIDENSIDTIVSSIEYSNAIELAEMMEKNEVSSTAAKDIWNQMKISGGNPTQIAKEKNLIQVSDSGELEKIVAEVIASNQKAANDIKSGEMKAIGYLVGQVMKASNGKANPGIVQQIIKKQLEN